MCGKCRLGTYVVDGIDYCVTDGQQGGNVVGIDEVLDANHRAIRVDARNALLHGLNLGLA